MSTKDVLSCNYCAKQYIRKRSYHEHVAICKEINKSKYLKRVDEMEEIEEEEIPSNKEMYNIMKKLLYQYQKQQNEIMQLRKKLNTKENNENIIKRLNHNVSVKRNEIIWFEDCISNYKIKEDVFDRLFGNKTNSSDVEILIKDILIPIDKTKLSIQCAEDKVETLYTLEENRDILLLTWQEVSKEMLENFIRELQNICLVYLMGWKKENEIQIQQDNQYYQQKYLPVMNRVMNFNIKPRILKSILCNIIKRDI